MTLYKLTNRMTGMSYVGATTQSLAKRCGEHRAQAKRGLSHPLSCAIREHGWEAFDVQHLGSFGTLDELHAAERATIAAVGTLVPTGYNRASGGLGTPDCRHADETKKKLAAVQLGRRGAKAWNKGLTVPLEVRQKISAGLKGHRTWNKGVPATEEHRAALRASHVGKVNPAARAIEVDGQSFTSILDAANRLGLSRMQVRYKLMTGRARYLQKG